MVKSGTGDSDKPFRPTVEANASTTNVSNDQMQRCLAQMMIECWTEKETARPPFDVCLDVIYAITGDKYVTFSKQTPLILIIH